MRLLNASFKTASETPLPVVLDARVVSSTGGGPDKTILNSPRFFTSAGYRMVCAYMHPPGDPGFKELRHKAAAWGAPLLSIPDRGPWDWQVLSSLLQLCRRQRVRIWHGHDYKSNALGLLLCKLWPMHLVTTVHGWVQQTRRTPLYYKIDQWCLPHYASVICVSNDLYLSARKCGVSAERCVLIENGIDAVQFARRRNQEYAKLGLGLPVDRLVIGAVGRMAPEKGYDLLIRAVHKLVTDGEKVTLVLIGDGEERQKLTALAGALGIAEHVRFVGYRADPQPFYEAMDIFALSSLREGLPNVVLEAMAMEVPVVATRVAGVPRLIEDDVNGLLVEAGSADGLARGLARLLGDAELRQRFQSEGRRTVESRYSFADRIKKIAGIYDRLLAKGRNPARERSNGKAITL